MDAVQHLGEGGISTYHLQGGDLVWEIGTGYFGCRTADGNFDAEKFKEKANWEQVKMIEIYTTTASVENVTSTPQQQTDRLKREKRKPFSQATLRCIDFLPTVHFPM